MVIGWGMEGPSSAPLKLTLARLFGKAGRQGEKKKNPTQLLSPLSFLPNRTFLTCRPRRRQQQRSAARLGEEASVESPREPSPEHRAGLGACPGLSPRPGPGAAGGTVTPAPRNSLFCAARRARPRHTLHR